MTQLSPQTQAIVDTFDFHYYQKARNRQDALASVLRILADNVAPEKYVSFTPGDAGFDKGRKQKNDCIRDAILDIATELEQI